MGKQINEEREFSENIERLLAGEEVKAGEGMSQDYQTAINFAQRLVSLHDEPSLHFKDQLRRRLFLKLAEQEAEESRKKEKANWFWEALRKLIPQNPVWRTATATVVVVVLAIVVLWGTGIFTQAPEQMMEKGPAPAMAPPPNGITEEAPAAKLDSGTVLRIEATFPETNVYLLEEEVKTTIVFRNVSSESINVTPFPPAIQINRFDTDEVVRSFAPGSDMAEIPPAGTLDYTLVWKQLDDNDQQVEPGRYSIIVSEVTIQKDTEPPESHLSFGPLADLLIQSP